jgi:hypothetical protein
MQNSLEAKEALPLKPKICGIAANDGATSARFRRQGKGLPGASCVAVKPPEGGSSISNLLIVDQAAINAGFDFRR